MDYRNRLQAQVRFVLILVFVFFTVSWFVAQKPFQASHRISSPVATYSRGVLRVVIPYRALKQGPGRVTMEVLDPEDHVLGRTEQTTEVAEKRGQWQSEIRLNQPLSSDDLVWHRLRYRLEYDDAKVAGVEAIESISEILRRPVVHILGQQSYLAGGRAAVRVIVTDSKNEVITGRGTVRIELLAGDEKPRQLFAGQLNRRGTTEAQFRFPAEVGGQLPVALCRGHSDRFN